MVFKQVQIIIVILVLFSNVITNPIKNSTEIKLKTIENPPQQKIVTVIPGDEILPYLKNCDNQEPETQILCANYYDMQERMKISKIEFNQSIVYDLLHTNDSSNTVSTFCAELEKELPQKLNMAKDVDNPLNVLTCMKYCIDLNIIEVNSIKYDNSIKPICKLIYLGCQLISANAASPELGPNIQIRAPNNSNSNQNDKKTIIADKNIESISKITVVSKNITKDPEIIKEPETKEETNIPEQHDALKPKTTEVKKNITKPEEKSLPITHLPDKSEGIELAGDIVISQEEKTLAESRKPNFPEVGNDMGDDGNNLGDIDDEYNEEGIPKIDNPPQQTKESPEFVVDPETKVAEPHVNSLDTFVDDPGSNFFSYFLFAMFASILLYVCYHNKTKVLALLLEGRRSQGGRNGSRRKHTAAYRKLDTNLEEAITSTPSGRSTQIIY